MSDLFEGLFKFDESELLDLSWLIRYYNPSHMKYGWTDEMCLIEGQKCCVWREIPANKVEGHLIRFINLWFSAANKDESEICSTIRNVLLMLPLGLSNELLLKDVFDSATDAAQVPPAANDKEILIEEPLIDHLDYKETADVLAFHNWLKQHFSLLKLARAKTPIGQPHCSKYNCLSQKLRVALGFCALLLMRMMTKKEFQMARYFPYLVSKAFDRLFPELGLNVSLVSPTPELLKLVKSALSNQLNHEPINLLHLLVFQFLKSKGKDDASSQFAVQILEDGCLKVLEGTGLGLVTMFQDVKLMYSNIAERSLLSYIAHREADEESKEKLIKFLDMYCQEDNLQYSWKWARILSRHYFSDMNIRENKPLCSKFAALLLDKNPGACKHHDIKSDNNAFLDYSVKWSESARIELQNLNDELQEEFEEICVDSLLAQWAEFITQSTVESPLSEPIRTRLSSDYRKFGY